MDLAFAVIEHGSAAWREAVRLREGILRVPLGSRFTVEELAEEQEHHQIVGYVGSELIATAVLVPKGESMKMQRVVVVESLRNKAIGARMMAFCEAFARDKGSTSVYCHARDTAVRFYRKNGYLAEGDMFNEDGIPHLKMRKELITN